GGGGIGGGVAGDAAGAADAAADGRADVAELEGGQLGRPLRLRLLGRGGDGEDQQGGSGKSVVHGGAVEWLPRRGACGRAGGRDGTVAHPVRVNLNGPSDDCQTRPPALVVLTRLASRYNRYPAGAGRIEWVRGLALSVRHRGCKVGVLLQRPSLPTGCTRRTR